MKKKGNKRHTYAVILAGGVGSRFWPVSRVLEPKQFLNLNGKTSLLQQTIDRIFPFVEPEKIFIVSNEKYKFQLQRQADFFSIPSPNIILEPSGKNTAPAIGLLAQLLSDRDPQATMIVLPADHYIKNVKLLLNTFRDAVRIAQDEILVTIGITPEMAHTGYGYIKVKPQGKTKKLVSGKNYPVERFVEKPDLKRARQYLASGYYFWNSGMFIWKAGVITQAIKKHIPALARALKKLNADSIDESVWKRIQSISIDYGVLEKAEHVEVIPVANLGWNDLGSWSALSKVMASDKDGNCIKADCLSFDCKNTTVWGTDRLIATVGLQDMVVVDTEDALLVCHREKTEQVKQVVDEIKKKKREEHFSHKTVKRPWGTYTVINTGKGFKVKSIMIEPHHRLSLQRHFRRSEHWVVVEGIAKITCDEKIFYRKQNESFYLSIGSVHRLENATDNPLRIVEVQCGEYLEEDDIERVEDDFGRIKKTLVESAT